MRKIADYLAMKQSKPCFPRIDVSSACVWRAVGNGYLVPDDISKDKTRFTEAYVAKVAKELLVSFLSSFAFTFYLNILYTIAKHHLPQTRSTSKSSTQSKQVLHLVPSASETTYTNSSFHSHGTRGRKSPTPNMTQTTVVTEKTP